MEYRVVDEHGNPCMGSSRDLLDAMSDAVEADRGHDQARCGLHHEIECRAPGEWVRLSPVEMARDIAGLI